MRRDRSREEANTAEQNDLHSPTEHQQLHQISVSHNDNTHSECAVNTSEISVVETIMETEIP